MNLQSGSKYYYTINNEYDKKTLGPKVFGICYSTRIGTTIKGQTGGANEVESTRYPKPSGWQNANLGSSVSRLGTDHSDKGDHGGSIDLWKDKKGNVYEKNKNGDHYDEPIGINLNTLTNAAKKAGVGATIVVGVYEVFKWGAAILLAPETLGTSLEVAIFLP